MERLNPSEVKDRVRAILSRMADLEKELEDEFHRRENQALYQISNRKVRFEEDLCGQPTSVSDSVLRSGSGRAS